MEPDDSFAPSRQGDWLAPLLQGWANSQQAVGLFDEQDRLQYANAVYREIFLGGQEGSFTPSELLRYGFEHRTGTVIECGDVEAFIADLYTRPCLLIQAGGWGSARRASDRPRFHRSLFAMSGSFCPIRKGRSSGLEGNAAGTGPVSPARDRRSG